MKARTFPCKGCGANLEFDPQAASLRCPYCQFLEKIPETAEEIEEYDFDDYLAKPKKFGYGGTGIDVTCQGCGAVTHVGAQTLSGTCPYCSKPYTVEQKTASEEVIAPEGLVPFRVSRSEAAELFRRWIRGLWFAPTTLKRLAQLQGLQGVYRPFWTFDAATSSYYEGERGDYYYETEYYTAYENGRPVRRSRQVRKIRWSWRSGSFRKFFDDVLVPAGTSLDWDTEYRLEGLVPYQEDYLAGFVAERYSVGPEDGWAAAKRIIDGALHREACSRIGGDLQRNVTVRTAYFNKTFKHVLLPLYVATYVYGKKAYRFQINGQTGEVRGERPYSFWKILLLILMILAVIGAAAWLAHTGAS